MPKIVDLHVHNGLEMGHILRTDKACSSITNCINLQKSGKSCVKVIKENYI